MAVIPKIELTGVLKSFDTNHVLKGVNLTVAPKESLVIIGTSGCVNRFDEMLKWADTARYRQR